MNDCLKTNTNAYNNQIDDWWKKYKYWEQAN